ncbi:peptidase associated/transthyretin-like domain-containing protein [Frigoriglobus tundricola]|uniref:Carboxypeptidase regulatory-like domain-containing protein n=1 Tax=Frigoriglobus tundricola TaxID=2774151 RepID=A0A6M5YW22_9BACT|nr:carboxypeptidase-like regulatory domain-containing protein [Frigoriglobus tundricola]QJW98139.1 hypothetical protein FTUN_5719 [Frigoriglobus tundricola]
MRRLYSGAVFSFVVIWSAGCTGEPKADVTGQVTYNGKPLAFGSVIMLKASGPGEPAVAEIQPDGTYTFRGIPVGETKIGVVSSDPNIKLDLRGDQKQLPPKADPKLWFPIPSKYAQPTSSGLSCNLSAGSNTHGIDLK